MHQLVSKIPIHLSRLLSPALLCGIVLLTSTPLARADDDQVQAKDGLSQAIEAKPLPSAESLGLEGSTEAALLLTGTKDLTIIQLGTRSLSTTEDFILVRGLSDELLSLILQSPSRSWEGSIRVYGGQLTQTDALRLLSSSEAEDLASLEFDLFEFYDRLDRLSTLTTKLAYCQAMELNPPPPPDDALVRDLCQRLQRKADMKLEAARDETNVSNEDDLNRELETNPEEATDRKLAELQRLYRKDGRERKRPPGSALRYSLAGAGFGGAALGLGLALNFEVSAEREYLLYRQAERVGDDLRMTRQLFLTQQFDQRRNAAVGAATASAVGAVVALILQQVETRRFERYRAAAASREDQAND